MIFLRTLKMKMDELIKKYDLINDGIYYHFNTNGAAPTKGQVMSIV